MTAEVPPTPSDRTWTSNERLGILNGWAVFLGDGFLNVTVVVAGFAARLGANEGQRAPVPVRVGVQRQVGVLGDGLDHAGADGQVGHEVPVHNVHMDPVCGFNRR